MHEADPIRRAQIRLRDPAEGGLERRNGVNLTGRQGTRLGLALSDPLLDDGEVVG